MAQQQAVKRAPEGAENGNSGRPARREKGSKVFDYERSGQSFRNDADFQNYLAGYPNKSGILAYVYRLHPVIDMSLIGVAEKSIMKTSVPAEMTREYVAQRFGRGKYLLKLSDANRERNHTEAARTWFEVNDPDLDPIYDPRTLRLSDQQNMDEIARLIQAGVLIRNSETGLPRLRTDADGPQTPPQPAAAPAPAVAAPFGGALMERLLEKAFTNAGGMSPGDSMRNSLEIVKLMREGAGPQLSAEQLADVVTARLERTLGQRTNGDGLFEQYERVDAFIQKVRGVAAPVADGAPVSAGTLGIVREIVGELKELVPQVIGGYIQLQEFREMQQRGRRQQTFRRPAASPQVQGQQQAPPQAPQATMTIPQRIEEIAAMGFEKMDAGVNGYDFAAFVCTYHPGGLEIFKLVSPHGVPAVTGLAGVNPKFAKYFTPEKRESVENFLSDFFSFDPDGGQDVEPPLEGEVVQEATGATA